MSVVLATKNWKPSLRARAAAELELRRRRQSDPLSFREFIQRVHPRLEFYRHIDNLCSVLQRVADGEIDRLMIFMPPRHGKSEVVSRLFTAYYLYRYPERWTGINSYADALARTLSRNARDHYQSAGGTIRADASAMNHWETGQGGGMWAAGVGGPITGKGFHLGVIDDPLKNAEEAASETIREKQKDWYRSTFYTRAEPGAAIIVIQTRWHEDDLSGWLLAGEGDEDDEPERWHIVSMPAIAEEDRPELPATCTGEPDPRQPGEPLCVERYPLAKLHKLRRRVGTYFWSALYQQRPTPPEGDMFQRSQFRIADRIPEMVGVIRYWDKAGSTSRSAKKTAGVKLGLGQDGKIYILHVVNGKWQTADRRRVMLETARTDGRGVVVGIEQEPGSSGLDSVRDEIALLREFACFADAPTGDKDTRLRPFQAQAQIDNVFLVRGAWNEGYIDEMCSVPHGKYRDQADATAGAYNRLIELARLPDEDVVVHDEDVRISPY